MFVWLVDRGRTRLCGYNRGSASPADVFTTYKLAGVAVLVIFALLMLLSICMEYSREYNPTTTTLTPSTTSIPAIIGVVILLVAITEGLCMWSTIKTLLVESRQSHRAVDAYSAPAEGEDDDDDVASEELTREQREILAAGRAAGLDDEADTSAQPESDRDTSRL